MHPMARTCGGRAGSGAGKEASGVETARAAVAAWSTPARTQPGVRAQDYGDFVGAAPGSSVTLRLADGRRLNVAAGYRGSGNLPGTISRCSYHPLLARVVAQGQAGATVKCGHVVLAPDALRY